MAQSDEGEVGDPRGTKSFSGIIFCEILVI